MTATDSVYISYWIKHSANWIGSGRAYHPHMFLFLSDLDGAFDGPAYSFLDAYIENNYLNNGEVWFSIQDGKNIDETQIGRNLVGVTESRSVGGCNGDSDGYGPGSCYVSGSPTPTSHWNGKTWTAGTGFFDNTPSSPRYKGNWHHVEAYFKLNSIAGGTAQRDGIIQYWYDGSLIMQRNDIVIRTGAHPTIKFNQALLLPYIGDTSSVDQTFWIDNLVIATAPPGSVPPPSGSACDLNNDSSTNVSDVQLCANQAIAVSPCTAGDINHDSACNVIDVQRVVNAALGGACVSP